MVKTYVSASFCFLISSFVCAQNLVPNPSFEEFTVCPKELGKRQLYIEKWIQPTSGSIDYFHRCSQNCGVPQNVMGNQEAKSGDAYIGLTLYHERYRVYAEIQLKEPMIAGVNYKVEFAVCLSEKSKHAIGNIGAYFTVAKLESKVETVFEVYENIDEKGNPTLIAGLCRPQIKNSPSSFISDETEWTTVSGTFKAKGGERYMTIGNFFTTAGTPVMNGNGKNDYAYYFLDDVAVYQNGSKPEPFPRSTYVPEAGIARNGTIINGTVNKSTSNASNGNNTLAANNKSTSNTNSGNNTLAASNKSATNTNTGSNAVAVNNKSASNTNTGSNTLAATNKSTSNTNTGSNSVAVTSKSATNSGSNAVVATNKTTSNTGSSNNTVAAADKSTANGNGSNNTLAATSKSAPAAGNSNANAGTGNVKTIEVKKDPVKKIEPEPTNVKATILKHLYFEKNSSKILPESEEELTMLADILMSAPDMTIEIAGHTDESGNEPANKKLSLERAQAVSNFMQMLDIDPTRMICKGWGSTKPLADNKTEEGRVKNRRVEFTVVQK